MEELLNQLDAMVSPQVEQKGLRFDILSPKPLPFPMVIGDMTRLRQVLLNLLNNAVKFTERGRVSLRFSQTEDAAGADGIVMRFEIEDTGIGISPEQQLRLFQPFTQADSSMTRRYGGTGLGLSIVHELVDRMGGQVGVRSELGKGATFWVDLPCALPSKDNSPKEDRPDALLRVILAEDDPIQRDLLLPKVKGFGWYAEAVEGGEALLERLQRWEIRGMKADCLLIDWDMGDMTAIEAGKRVRAVWKDQTPPIIVLTVQPTEAMREAMSQGHIDAVLPKSTHMSALFNEVNAVVTRHQHAWQHLMDVTQIERTQIQWLPGVRIMVVDDSVINLEVVQKILGAEGADVVTCESGARAIDWLDDRLRAGEELPDLIFLDLQMPQMDGYAVAAAIRQRVGEDDLPPLVALTAGALSSERKRALDSGMIDYVTKPYDPAQLIRVIRRHVEAHRRAVVPIHEVLEGSRPRKPAPQEWAALGALTELSVDEVMDRLHGDVDALRPMLRRFLDEYHSLTQGIALPVNAAEREALTRKMHRLAGNSGLLGARQLHEHAKTAETLLREEADDAALSATLAQLAEHMGRLSRELSPLLHSREPDTTGSNGDGAQPSPPANDEELDRWREMLNEARYGALKQYAALAPGLEARWGEEVTRRLAQAIDHMDFELAVSILDGLRRGR